MLPTPVFLGFPCGSGGKESEVAQLCSTLCNPMDCSLPGSSFTGFSGQENQSGLPFPFPRDLPNPGIEPGSHALRADALPSEPPSSSAMRETWVQPLGWEDPLGKRKATHSSILENLGRKKSDRTE